MKERRKVRKGGGRERERITERHRDEETQRYRENLHDL